VGQRALDDAQAMLRDAQVAEHLGLQQTDGVSRNRIAEPGMELRAGCRAADGGAALEHFYLEPGLRQVAGTGEAVVPGADDDCVVALPAHSTSWNGVVFSISRCASRSLGRNNGPATNRSAAAAFRRAPARKQAAGRRCARRGPLQDGRRPAYPLRAARRDRFRRPAWLQPAGTARGAPGGCRTAPPAPAVAAGSGSSGAARSCRCRGIRFIGGEPMSPATKVEAGRAYTSSGAPICSTRPAFITIMRCASVIASTWS